MKKRRNVVTKCIIGLFLLQGSCYAFDFLEWVTCICCCNEEKQEPIEPQQELSTWYVRPREACSMRFESPEAIRMYTQADSVKNTNDCQ